MTNQNRTIKCCCSAAYNKGEKVIFTKYCHTLMHTNSHAIKQKQLHFLSFLTGSHFFVFFTNKEIRQHSIRVSHWPIKTDTSACCWKVVTKVVVSVVMNIIFYHNSFCWIQNQSNLTRQYVYILVSVNKLYRFMNKL